VDKPANLKWNTPLQDLNFVGQKYLIRIFYIETKENLMRVSAQSKIETFFDLHISQALALKYEFYKIESEHEQ
jgi:hypothetical protein